MQKSDDSRQKISGAGDVISKRLAYWTKLHAFTGQKFRHERGKLFEDYLKPL